MKLFKEEEQLILIIKYAPLVLTFCLAVFISVLVIFAKNTEFEENKKYIEQSYYAWHKEYIKEQVEGVYARLEEYKQKRELLFENSTKQRVYEAHSIATNLYNTYKDTKSKEEILELIRESLRNIRFFDGYGAYFIFSPQGEVLMHGQNHQLEGSSLWDYKDIEGKYSFRNLAKILENKSETFFTWYWSKANHEDKDHKKMGFFKVFEPYGFYIGTGNYIEDFDSETQKNILEEINQITFHNKQGYIFIVDYDGIMLAHNDKTLINTNTINWSDKNGHKIIENIITFAQNKGSGYIQYDGVKKPTTQLVSFKTSYVKKFDSWQWVIGTGFYNDELNMVIEKKIEEQKQDNLAYIRNVILICIALTVVLLLMSVFISNILKNKFKNFKESLQTELQRNRIQNKKLEKTLNQKMEYENVVFNSNLVSITDLRGVIIYVNDAFCEITGYSKEELMGKNHNIMRCPEVPNFFYKTLWDTILKGEIWRGIITNIKKDKTKIYLSTTISPIRNEKGKIIKFVATRFDITEKINSDNELREKENILVQQSKMASMGEMIGAIAHQWRQPLSVISVSATGVKLQKELDVLSDEFLNEAMDSINNSVQYLSSTIDDFRNFFNPNKAQTQFNVTELYEKCFKLIKVQLENHNIMILKDIDAIEMHGYENELLQVMINILNNAKDQLIIKNESVKVISIKAKKDKENVLISIADNGGGILNENITKIFDPYFTTKTDMDGTGIGLYMSKDIVEKHMNGELLVSNEVFKYNDKTYKGACFTIKVPV
jgi:PAS domain S-box-containing protein